MNRDELLDVLNDLLDFYGDCKLIITKNASESSYMDLVKDIEFLISEDSPETVVRVSARV